MSEFTLVDEYDVETAPGGPKGDQSPRIRPAFVCSVCEALQPDDQIFINDDLGPLDVLGFEERTALGDVNRSDYPYHVWWLRGDDGVEWRLQWSHTHEYFPELHRESQLTTSTQYGLDGTPEQRTFATDPPETVFTVQPAGVDYELVSDWVLKRQCTHLGP